MLIRIVKSYPKDDYEAKTIYFLKLNTVEINLDELRQLLRGRDVDEIEEFLLEKMEE